MSLAEHIVVCIMGWSDFQTTSTKLDIYISVFDDRYYATDQRYDDLMTAEPMILWIFRVDTHCCIAHNGLRTSSSDDGIVALVILMEHFAFFACQNHRVDICVCHVILEMIKL